MIVLANVRARWASVLATALAVVVGAALVTATLIITDSSQPDTQPRLAATSALVVPSPPAADRSADPDPTVPWSPAEAADLLARLAAIPGVEAAVPDRSFYAQAFLDGRPVGNPEDEEAGHGWSSLRLGPYRLAAGRHPAAGTTSSWTGHSACRSGPR